MKKGCLHLKCSQTYIPMHFCSHSFWLFSLFCISGVFSQQTQTFKSKLCCSAMLQIRVVCVNVCVCLLYYTNQMAVLHLNTFLVLVVLPFRCPTPTSTFLSFCFLLISACKVSSSVPAIRRTAHFHLVYFSLTLDIFSLLLTPFSCLEYILFSNMHALLWYFVWAKRSRRKRKRNYTHLLLV